LFRFSNAWFYKVVEGACISGVGRISGWNWG